MYYDTHAELLGINLIIFDKEKHKCVRKIINKNAFKESYTFVSDSIRLKMFIIQAHQSHLKNMYIHTLSK